MDAEAAYESLGLEPGAGVYHVRHAYKHLARLHHPDCGGDAASFRRIVEAHEFLLKDPTADSVSMDCQRTTLLQGAVIRGLMLTGPFEDLLILDEDKCMLMDRQLKQHLVLSHPDEVSFLCCCLMGMENRMLAIGDSAGTVHVVSLSMDFKYHTTLDVEAPVLALASPENDSSLLLACVANKICLMSVESGVVCRIMFDQRLGFHAETVCFVGGHAVIGGCGDEADGQLVCVYVDISSDNFLFDAEDEEEPPLLWTAEHDHAVYALTAIPTVARFAAAAGSIVAVHDSATGGILMRMAATGTVYSIGLNPRAEWLVAAGSDECIHIFDAKAGTRKMVLANPDGDHSCCLNTACVNTIVVGNTSVFSGGYDKCVTEWQLKTCSRHTHGGRKPGVLTGVCHQLCCFSGNPELCIDIEDLARDLPACSFRD